MYIPKIYSIDDDKKIAEFMAANNFADLVTVYDGEICSNKVPLYFDKNSMVLFGHLGRTNPQLKLIEKSVEALVIFSGPHAYISPQWYESKHMVPTWNFQTVQVRGTTKVIDRESLVDVLNKMSDFHESSFPQQWSMDELDQTKLETMLNLIVVFKIEINDIKFKEKMSQNRSVADQKSVIKSLQEQNSHSTEEVARIMANNLDIKIGDCTH